MKSSYVFIMRKRKYDDLLYQVLINIIGPTQPSTAGTVCHLNRCKTSPCCHFQVVFFSVILEDFVYFSQITCNMQLC